MAIERINGLTLAGLKDLIDSLGWFAASDENSGTYTFYADEEKQKPVIQYTSSSFRFSSVGSADNVSSSIQCAFDIPTVAFKTKNGLLLSNTTAYASSYWNPWTCILGKTNNGAIAAVFSRSASPSEFCRFYSSAYGESVYSGLGYLEFRYGYNYPTNARLTSQIAGCQIPTCPDNGISYIKGALGLVVAPWDYYWGEVDIGGVRYATNGYLALNDED